MHPYLYNFQNKGQFKETDNNSTKNLHFVNIYWPFSLYMHFFYIHVLIGKEVIGFYVSTTNVCQNRMSVTACACILYVCVYLCTCWKHFCVEVTLHVRYFDGGFFSSFSRKGYILPYISSYMFDKYPLQFRLCTLQSPGKKIIMIEQEKGWDPLAQ